MSRPLIAVLLAAAALSPAPWGMSAPLRAQNVSAEYRVKAAYLYNFAKFVEWPPEASTGPLVICVASRNPFGTVLAGVVSGELINERPVETRTILEPTPGCHVLFVPNGAPGAYLAAARNTPTLTVGETSTFVEQGGVANFFISGSNVRFEISPTAAERARLRISSRLLQLARIVDAPAGT